MQWRISLSVPVENTKEDWQRANADCDKAQTICESLGGEEGGRGTGFGYRDADWGFKSLEKAQMALQEIKKLGLSEMLELSCEDEEEVDWWLKEPLTS